VKVLALVPDYVENPSGGLGEQYRHMLKNLKGKVDYYTVGYPEQNSIKNYKSARNPIPVFKHAALTTIYGQSIYLLKALEFKEEFDVIHAYDWSTFYAGYLCKEHFKKPLVCTVQLSLQQLNKDGIYYCHDPNTMDGIHINQLQIYFEELGLITADKVIQVSEYYNNLYPDYHDKSVVITNGIEIKDWVKKRSPKLPGKNKLKFCYIGRASPMKGLDVILNCNIPDDIDFYFVVSSKNAEEPIFTNIKNKGNGRNIFHIPGLYGQDKIDFLYSMDGIVMPSKHEPFGIVALEALMSECMLFTTGVGGIGEILEGVPYVNIQTSEGFVEGINNFKNLTVEEKNNIIETGKQKALSFPWSKSADKLLNVYEDIMNSRK
jgi:glycosyltransferase involved in cell wall biosynthesis